MASDWWRLHKELGMTLLAFSTDKNSALIASDSAATYASDDPAPDGYPSRFTRFLPTKLHQHGEHIAWSTVGTFGDHEPFKKWLEIQPLDGWEKFAADLGKWCRKLHAIAKARAIEAGLDRFEPTEVLVVGRIKGVIDAAIGSHVQSGLVSQLSDVVPFLGPMTPTAAAAWDAVRACAPSASLHDAVTMRTFMESMCVSLVSHGVGGPVHVWRITHDGIEKEPT